MRPAERVTGILAAPAMTAHSQTWQTYINHILDWLKKHWLSSPGVTAAATVGLVIVGLIPLIHRRRRSGDERRSPHRAKVLRLVRQGWIAGVLEVSLAGTEPLALDRRRSPNDIDDQTPMAPRLDFRRAQVPTRKSALEVFDEAGGRLLILGAPGAGKTTLLLQLAKDLLDRADHDLEQPVPIVINLASWAEHRQPLNKWASKSLAVTCKVPTKTASRWISQDSVILLLDGLDEVPEYHRAACVSAINSYLREHVLAQVAVCCRVNKVRELAEGGARLQVREAVQLEPPTDSQISAYLDHLESTGAPVADIRAALAADPDLKELLRSPLMLNVIRFGYYARTKSSHTPTAAEQWPARLWDAYITGIFTQYPLPKKGYRLDQAITWLAWLAKATREHGLIEFRLES